MKNIFIITLVFILLSIFGSPIFFASSIAENSVPLIVPPEISALNIQNVNSETIIKEILSKPTATPLTLSKQDLNETGKSHVLISSFEITGDSASSGEVFTLLYTLKNTSQTSDLYNIKITIKSPENIFIPKTGESSSIFLENIEKDSEIKLSLELKAALKSSGDCPLEFFIEYDDDLNQNLSTTETLWIPVTSANSIAIDNIVIDDFVIINQESLLSLRYSNFGTENMESVALVISGNIVGDEIEIETGPLKSGESNYIDYSIVFDEPGEQSLALSFNCLDQNGGVHDVNSKNIIVNVKDESNDVNLNTIKYSTKKDSLYNNIILGIIAIVSMSVIIFLIFFRFYRH